MKHSCYMNHEVVVEFAGVTSKELGEILALDLGEMKKELSYGDFIIPKIDRMYEHFDDGWDEPIVDSWKVVYKIESCGGISRSSLKWYNEKTLNEEFDLAEKVAEYVRSKLNLIEEES